MTQAKQKAIELVKSFKDFVNPYVGSGMLSNTYDNDAILFQAKKCAHASIDFFFMLGGIPEMSERPDLNDLDYIKAGIDLVTVEDIFDKN